MKKLISLCALCAFAILQLDAACTFQKNLTSASYDDSDQGTIDGWFTTADLITIPSGVTVTIVGCTLRVRLPGTIIRIQAGGRLILDDVVVVVGSAYNSCGAPYFSGFDVKGTAGTSQYVTRHLPFDPSNTGDFTDVSRYNTDKGVLIMTGCEVKKTGNGSTDDVTIKSTNGGCVELFDCTFTNNYQCIKLLNYNYASGTDLADYNAFNIINCTFETTNTASLSDVGQYFINLDQVQRVQIEGCHFLNNITYTDNYYNTRKINTGITYSNSSFSIQRSGFNRLQSGLDTETDCPEYTQTLSRKNKFTDLPYAIHAGSGGLNDHSFVVADCEITDCLMGIQIVNGIGGTIARNSYTFNDAHKYEVHLLENDDYPLSNNDRKDEIYFITISASEKIVVTENTGEILADDYKITSNLNYDIYAAFIVVDLLQQITDVTDQIQIYRNCSRSFTNYLGEAVLGGFKCSGGRSTAQTTYGVYVNSAAGSVTKSFLNINCNDFSTLSDPIYFANGDIDLNSNVGGSYKNWLENDGQKASMNVFTNCSDPAIASVNQTIKYRYLSSGTGYDPGAVAGSVSKTSTSNSYDCGGLKCKDKSWGTHAGSPFSIDKGTIWVYPNPAGSSFSLQWQTLPEYEGTYHIDLYNSLGQRISSYQCKQGRLEVDVTKVPDQILLGILRTETTILGNFKVRTL